MAQLPTPRLTDAQRCEATQESASSDDGKVDLFRDSFSWRMKDGRRVTAAHMINDLRLSDDLLQSSELVATKLGHTSCVEHNEPTPLALATHRVKAFLQLITKSSAGKSEIKMMRTTLIKATLEPYDQVAKNATTTSSSNDNKTRTMEAAVRHIEAQVLMRLQYWASLGAEFVRLYRSLNLIRKRKRSHLPYSYGTLHDNGQVSSKGEMKLISDIIDLFSLAAIKLPHDRPFQEFLQDCLDKAFHSGKPSSRLPKNAFQIIYNNFEIVDAEVKASRDFVPFALKPLPAAREKKSLPSSKDQIANIKTINKAGAEASGTDKLEQKQNTTLHKSRDMYIPQAVALVAPDGRKKNSLLGNRNNGQRSRFVGSHFNTNLSNASSLFREVKVTKKTLTTKIALRTEPGARSSLSKGRTMSKTCKPQKNPSETNRNGKTSQMDHASTSKRKQPSFFQPNQSTAAKPAKIQKVKFSSGNHIQETPVPSTKKSLSRTSGRDSSLDNHAARRVVVAARNALQRKRQI